MAEIIKGAAVAAALTEELAHRCAALKAKGIFPKLAILRAGEKQEDLTYERAAIKRCEKVGIEVQLIVLPAGAAEAELIDEIEKLNHDRSVHGVLIFMPLPDGIDEKNVRAALAVSKDVDGITPGSQLGLYAGSGEGFAPCTAEACMEILKAALGDITGQRAVVVGRSMVIGKPVSLLLLKENATVTICHSRTKGLSDICRSADILIAAAGHARLIGVDCAAPGQTVIDVGINVDADGRICGDARFEELVPLVKRITPVPGGVGAVTTSILAKHVIEAAERSL